MVKSADQRKGTRREPENSRIDLQSGTWSSVREEYNRKYPLFGSQIHFTIDVIRHFVNDLRRK